MSTAENNASLVASVDASRSNDNGTIVSYEWTTSTGQSATGKTASLVFNQAGTHTITLKITDDEGKTATLQNSLVVNLNSPPQVSFNTSVTEGNIPLVVALDASASTDDGSIASYAWSTSSGQTASGKTASVTFNDVGTHTVNLTVTDNLGKTASLEKTIVATKQLIRLVAANYPTDLKMGQSFDLTLQFVPDTAKPADGVQVYLEFDPTKLKVNQVTNSGVLDYELFNEIGANYINFAAGSFSNPVPLTPFDLVTINFTALQATGDIGTLLHFDPNQSNVTHLGEFLPQQYEDMRLVIGEKVALTKGKVNLQGRAAAPDVSWETELKLYFEGTSYIVNTDNSGHSELPNAISLGDHSLCVKNSHTLANRIGPPLVLGGDGMLDFGTLLEGDVNDDNKINLLDISELTKLTNGQKVYHKQADLNADGQIDIADPNLLKSNFNKPKPGDTAFCQWDGSTYRKGSRDGSRNGTVVLNTSPVPMNLPVGSTFKMDILVQTSSSQATVDAAAVYLNFDPSTLQVNRLIHGSYLDFGLLNEFDNDQGQISYAAGLWNNPPTIGPFTLVTVEFTVLVAGGEQTLSFNTTAPRETDVAFAGESVLNKETGTTLNFEHPVVLTVSKDGEGTVIAPGIDCGNDCSEEYALNTQVTLTATADFGSTFAGWSGVCSSTGTCQVTMSQAQSVTATFVACPMFSLPAPGWCKNGLIVSPVQDENGCFGPPSCDVSNSLTVTQTGDGNGSVQSRPAGIRCGKTCQKEFPENSTVKLVAFTSKGSIFTGWGGACSGTAKKTTVTVNDALTCTANFEVSTPAPEGMYNLTVSVEGDGEGVVTANGINCAGDCQQNHKGGKNLVLKATPDASSTFVGWGSDCEGTKSPLQVKLAQDMTCVATFQSK